MNILKKGPRKRLIGICLLSVSILFLFVDLQGQGKEDFTAVKQSGASYRNLQWTGNNGELWSATEAVANKDLDGGAITLRYGEIRGVLTSDQAKKGIGSLSFDAKIPFGDMDKEMYLLFTAGLVEKRLELGSLAEKDKVYHFGPFEINACAVNSFSLALSSKMGGGRLTIDNLVWTAVLEGNCDPGLTTPPSRYKLEVLSPINGDTIKGTDLDVVFRLPSLENRTAKVHLENLFSGVYTLFARVYFQEYEGEILGVANSQFIAQSAPPDTVLPPPDTLSVERNTTLWDYVNFYPNPSRGCIVFTSDRPLWAELWNTQGLKCKEGWIGQGTRWCISSKGYYLLRFINKEKRSIVKKVIIQ